MNGKLGGGLAAIGDTPLVRLGPLVPDGAAEVWVKLEGANPTGSFKDRGMTVGTTQAVRTHARAVACASTGNTSASAAAGLSEAWQTLRIISVPKSPRMVPFGATLEFVGPSSSRTLAITFSPVRTATITGREDMKASISG